MEIKEIKTICTNGRELIVNIELVPVETGYAIVSLKRDRSLSLNEKVTIDTLQLPESHNGIPITTIKRIREDKNADYNVGSRNTPVNNLLLPDSITNIENGTFSYAFINNVRWPSKCTFIPTRAFFNSTLQVLTNTENVTSINKAAFFGCKKLESIYSEKMINCTLIEEQAFWGARKLTKFIWPSNCLNIPPFCFTYCDNLRLLKHTSKIKNIGEYAFDHTGIEKFIMGNECTYIGESCFRSCIKLKEFSFGNNCKTIPAYCFFDCKKLSRIKNCNQLSRIEAYAFSSCKNLTEFIWPEGCQTIPWNCFYESGIKNITITSKIINIEYNAFKNSPISEIDLSKTIVGKVSDSSFPKGVIVKYPYYI